jgi:hypothetical protein
MKEVRKRKYIQEREASVEEALYSPSSNEHLEHPNNHTTHLLGDTHACVSCFQTISNPICARCYLNHLRIWLEDHPISQAEKKKILKKIHSKIRRETLNDEPCIICGKESVSYCTYCFFLIAEGVIEKSHIPDIYIDEFEDTFNYKLYHNKYF